MPAPLLLAVSPDPVRRAEWVRLFQESGLRQAEAAPEEDLPSLVSRLEAAALLLDDLKSAINFFKDHRPSDIKPTEGAGFHHT